MAVKIGNSELNRATFWFSHQLCIGMQVPELIVGEQGFRLFFRKPQDDWPERMRKDLGWLLDEYSAPAGFPRKTRMMADRDFDATVRRALSQFDFNALQVDDMRKQILSLMEGRT